jgi:hypothetical protein
MISKVKLLPSQTLLTSVDIITDFKDNFNQENWDHPLKTFLSHQ